MHFTLEHLTELTDQVKLEGNPRLMLTPIPELPAGLILPEKWKNLLARPDAHRELANILWADGERIVPRIINAISKTLQAVGLLVTDTKQPSLVYIFTKNGEVFARRGYIPINKLPKETSSLIIDLATMYSIHDGWVDMFSGDMGLLPTREWKVLGGSEIHSQDGFLEVFRTGGNAMGFDLSESPATSYIIWSDEDVVSVDNFWLRLDSWIADELNNMDHVDLRE